MKEEKTGIPCPACGEIMLTSVIEKNIPHFGPVLIIVDRCAYCGYRETSVQVMGESHRTHQELIIDSPEKLEYYVVRGPTATVSIPELGMELRPVHGRGEAFITTVEGILLRFREKLDFLKHSENNPETLTRINALLATVERVMKGDYTVTIVIEDPLGKSIFYRE